MAISRLSVSVSALISVAYLFENGYHVMDFSITSPQLPSKA
ncbi:hypothetical protein PR001_g21612 [Phytophthora rubi]|uniref:Uncharacterized protein n=1 Tax=Phytophthora rubi TaxID=129364 RepID=A0A6A3J5T1_9STRA|nr:hypothetical protein PR002_g22182 [Phytophthora rubi]KAE8990020.1 hypothetical protein PR001_g21612 [Phytophthora rubi]